MGGQLGKGVEVSIFQINLFILHFQRGYSPKIYTGRFRPEVQPLTHLYIIFERKGTPFVYLLLTMLPLSRIYSLKVFIPFNCQPSSLITKDDSAFLICQSFARAEQVILLYMRCRNSPGCSFIPLIFMLYILTYFNMNMLYRIFNIILKISF